MSTDGEWDVDVVEIDPEKRYVRHSEVLGRGSFKTVYKAFDQLDGIEVAWNQVEVHALLEGRATLKSLHSEIQLLRSLRHDKIVKFFKSWVDPQKKTVNIITELFTSGSLRQYREKHKKVDMKALKGWARQILLGLDYLHSLSPPIIHRDLKCDNIFINGNHGEVKIGDLGLATIMQQSNKLGAYGTLEFMAPEIYKEEDYNELVDIYSFGLCLLEMVTFEYPYSECKNHGQLYRKVCAGKKPAGLSKVKDPEMKAFIEKCLVPAAERLSAKELLRDPFLGGPESGIRAAIPNIEQINNHSAPSEGPGFNIRRSPSSSDIDVNVGNPPIIYVVKNSGDDGSYSFILEVQKRVKDIEFRLKGRLRDEKSVLLLLRIADGHALLETFEFPFDLNSDTALSIASEMAEQQLEIAAQNVELISEMIDSLLVNLVDGWEPCVSMNRLVILDKKATFIGKTKGFRAAEQDTSSVTSFQNTSSSSADSIAMHVDNAMKHEGAVVINTNDSKSHSGRSSCASMDCNGYIANSATKCFAELYHRNIHAGLQVDGACLSSINVNDEDDSVFKWELETIELQYQQAMKDMFQKRQKAISEARHRAAQRKLLGVH